MSPEVSLVLSSYAYPFTSSPARNLCLVQWGGCPLLLSIENPGFTLSLRQSMLASRPLVSSKCWAWKDRFTCTPFVLWGANFMSWKLACRLLRVFNKPKCVWSITPTAAFYWLMRAERVHLKMERHLKFMGWLGSQLIIISHVKMWFPSLCFFLLGYWGVLSVPPSLWQRTSAVVMLGEKIKSNKGFRFPDSEFLDLAREGFQAFRMMNSTWGKKPMPLHCLSHAPILVIVATVTWDNNVSLYLTIVS